MGGRWQVEAINQADVLAANYASRCFERALVGSTFLAGTVLAFQDGVQWSQRIAKKTAEITEGKGITVPDVDAADAGWNVRIKRDDPNRRAGMNREVVLLVGPGEKPLADVIGRHPVAEIITSLRKEFHDQLMHRLASCLVPLR